MLEDETGKTPPVPFRKEIENAGIFMGKAVPCSDLGMGREGKNGENVPTPRGNPRQKPGRKDD
jgi:hypothetical protein